MGIARFRKASGFFLTMYIIIAIRDYPDLPIGWRDSYLVGQKENIDEAKEMARNEVNQRGGKYGCIIYDASRPNVFPANEVAYISRFEYQITA